MMNPPKRPPWRIDVWTPRDDDSDESRNPSRTTTTSSSPPAGSRPTTAQQKRRPKNVSFGEEEEEEEEEERLKEAKNQIPFLCALEKWNLEFNAAHATKECLRHFGLPVVLRDRKRILRRNKDPAKKTSGSGEQQSSTTALTLSEIRGNVKWGWAREATKSGVKEAKRGRFMIALKAFDRAIELDPKHVDAHVARGAVLAKNTDSEKMTVSRRVECLEEARRDFKLALELEEGNEDAKKYLEKVEEELLELRRKAKQTSSVVVVAAMPANKKKISAMTRVSSGGGSGVLPADRARLEQREKNKDRIEFTNKSINTGYASGAQKNALEEDKEMTEFLEAEIEAEMVRKEKEKHRKEKKKRKRKKKEKKSKHRKKKSRKKSSSSSGGGGSSSSSSSSISISSSISSSSSSSSS